MFVWQKSVAPESVEIWRQRLEFVGPERLAIVERPGITRRRLDVYLPTLAAARALVSAFGGRAIQLADAAWQPAAVSGPALSIAGRLAITGRPEELDELRAAGRALCIPAAMAFGTGEHATTAMCLRLLAEVARERRKAAWELIDLGAGTGILALGGRLLGAASAEGFDNDPHAVRTARENAAANDLRDVRFRRLDLIRSWHPARTWNVVVANLFSGLILELLPRIFRALPDDGDLILSGILSTQADDIQAALQVLGLSARKRRKGRWVAFHAKRSTTAD